MEIIRDYTKPIMNNKILTFGQPELITSGTYFTRILYNNNPLYIQTPKCKTKHEFLKSNKKIYTDLLFTNTEEDMLGWFEQLDEYCKDFMLLKSADWFSSSLTKEDIDNLWTSTFKLYKSGKNALIKVHVPIENIPFMKIYDDTERVREMDDITENTTVQTILEIGGIRFTSRSYQLNIELKQMMIINKIVHPIFNKCVIKPVYLEQINPGQLSEDDSNILNISNITNTGVMNNATITQTSFPPLLVNDTSKMEIINEGGDINVNDDTKLQPENVINLLNNIEIDYPNNENNENNENTDLEPIEINNLGININQEDITIKDPHVIYLEMYNERLNNAKKLLYESKALFQEAKQIKEKYKLNILEDINGYISD